MRDENLRRVLMLIVAVLPAIPLYWYFHVGTVPGIDGVPEPVPRPEWGPFLAGLGLVLAVALVGVWVVPRERRGLVAVATAAAGFVMMVFGASLGYWVAVVLAGWILAVTLLSKAQKVH